CVFSENWEREDQQDNLPPRPLPTLQGAIKGDCSINNCCQWSQETRGNEYTNSATNAPPEPMVNAFRKGCQICDCVCDPEHPKKRPPELRENGLHVPSPLIPL